MDALAASRAGRAILVPSGRRPPRGPPHSTHGFIMIRLSLGSILFVSSVSFACASVTDDEVGDASATGGAVSGTGAVAGNTGGGTATGGSTTSSGGVFGTTGGATGTGGATTTGGTTGTGGTTAT